MTVKELVDFLLTQCQDLPVAYSKYSEYCLLEVDDIAVARHCPPRNDGWVARVRPDKETQEYLVFPGN